MTEWKEFIVKQKNSLVRNFEIYEDNHQIGEKVKKELYYKGRKFTIDDSSGVKIYEKETEVGRIIIPMANFLTPGFGNYKALILGKEYKIKNIFGISMRFSVQNENEEEIIKYTKKGFIARKDLIQFSPKVNTEQIPIFICLIIFANAFRSHGYGCE